MDHKRCTFCTIATNKDSRTELLYQSPDDEDGALVVFRDIRPASKHHYLVCPKKHIKDAKALNNSHTDLVEQMIRIGKQVLREQGGDEYDLRIGFHWPPFTSVTHLHLHVISPISKTFDVRRVGKYAIRSFWFKTAEWMLDKLKQLPPISNNS